MAAGIFGIIVARGGSKGLPGKNVRLLAGKPMVAWTVEAALAAQRLDRVVVSTDDAVIAEAARLAGAEVPFLRPAHLAGDTASVVDAIFHAIDNLGEQPEWVVLLQATSPLRLAGDIDACIDLCLSRDAPAVASISLAAKSPYWMVTLDDQGHIHMVVPRDQMGDNRQSLPAAYCPNGAVYVARTEWLRRTRTFWQPGVTLGYIMPPERSVDVDTVLDFRLAELLMTNGV